MIYIYSLNCPETGNPRYIGKCTNPKNRLAAHLSKAKGHHTNHHCANWIRSLLSRGLVPTLRIIVELPPSGDWRSAETQAIAEYKAGGFDLTNGTSGGDGLPDLSPEVLKARGRKRSAQMRTPEGRAKLLATAGASHSRPDARKNHSSGAKSAWADPVKRDKMLAAMRTPEAVARRAEATRRRNADPEFAVRHRAKMKRISAEPEGRERMRRAREIRWSRS